MATESFWRLINLTWLLLILLRGRLWCECYSHIVAVKCYSHIAMRLLISKRKWDGAVMGVGKKVFIDIGDDASELCAKCAERWWHDRTEWETRRGRRNWGTRMRDQKCKLIGKCRPSKLHILFAIRLVFRMNATKRDSLCVCFTILFS